MDTTVDIYSKETMATLEGYFCEKSDVLEEGLYTLKEKSLIADVVAINLLLNESVSILGGGSTAEGGSNAPRYVKKAKAGSVEAEFEQADLRKAAVDLRTDAKSLVDRLLANARAKACSFGFDLPFFRDYDCEPPTATPFIVGKFDRC